MRDISETMRLGEPVRVGSRQGIIDEWEMVSYGRTYRVVVAERDGPNDEWFVMVTGEASEMYHEVRAWSIMHGSRTGGVVTAAYIHQAFRFDSMISEYLAILVASALGRPYAVAEVSVGEIPDD